MLAQCECSGQEHWDDLQDYFDHGDLTWGSIWTDMMPALLPCMVPFNV